MSIVTFAGLEETKSASNKNAFELHEQALACGAAKDFGLLGQAESWYYLKETGGYKQIDTGYKTIYEYIHYYWQKSKITADKIIRIHEVYVEQLGISQKELSSIGWGKLTKVVGLVTRNNVHELLDDMRNMTQLQIDMKIKKDQGLKPNEVKEKDGNVCIRMTGPFEIADMIQECLVLAKIIYSANSDFTEDRVPDMLAMELICSQFACSSDLDGNANATLDNAIRMLESSHNIKINYERVI